MRRGGDQRRPRRAPCATSGHPTTTTSGGHEQPRQRATTRTSSASPSVGRARSRRRASRQPSPTVLTRRRCQTAGAPPRCGSSIVASASGNAAPKQTRPVGTSSGAVISAPREQARSNSRGAAAICSATSEEAGPPPATDVQVPTPAADGEHHRQPEGGPRRARHDRRAGAEPIAMPGSPPQAPRRRRRSSGRAPCVSTRVQAISWTSAANPESAEHDARPARLRDAGTRTAAAPRSPRAPCGAAARAGFTRSRRRDRLSRSACRTATIATDTAARRGLRRRRRSVVPRHADPGNQHKSCQQRADGGSRGVQRIEHAADRARLSDPVANQRMAIGNVAPRAVAGTEHIARHTNSSRIAGNSSEARRRRTPTPGAGRSARISSGATAPRAPRRRARAPRM